MGTGIQREGSDKQEHIHKATGQFSKASKGGDEMCTPVLFIIQNIHNEQLSLRLLNLRCEYHSHPAFFEYHSVKLSTCGCSISRV